MTARLLIGLIAFCLCACDRSGSDGFVAPRLPSRATTSAWPPDGWAWGLIEIAGRPAQRYGVSGPASAPIGDVIILPGYGESAEWWFETATDLNREGYTVWVLDGDGQGGSGRHTRVRDLGHTSGSENDIESLRGLIALVIRPKPSQPIVLIGSGTAGLTALGAAEQAAPITRVIVSGPKELSVVNSELASTAARLGLTSLRASGGSPWTRDHQKRARTTRERVALSWAIANPDLRMGGPSTGWLKARQILRAATTKPEALGRVTIPVTIIAPTAATSLTCDGIPRCLMRPLPARMPYHIEEDRIRAAWIAALIGELGTDHAT